MTRKLITAAELRMLITAEIVREPDCAEITRFDFLRIEEEGAQNWTVRILGLQPDREAANVFGQILVRLGKAYDVAWETRH